MPDRKLIAARVGGNKTILVEATQIGPESATTDPYNQNISIPTVPELNDVWEMVGEVADGIAGRLDRAKAKKAVVEFGIEIGAEAGQLTALLVRGSGKATIKITLEWS
jgi:hypothetical protein